MHVTPEGAVSLRRCQCTAADRHPLGHLLDLAEEPLDDPPVRMLAEGRCRGIDSERAWILKLGETRRGGKVPQANGDFPSDEPLPFPGAD